jgi:hypothetical protein
VLDWLRKGSSCGLVSLSAETFFIILVAINFARKVMELIVWLVYLFFMCWQLQITSVGELTVNSVVRVVAGC